MPHAFSTFTILRKLQYSSFLEFLSFRKHQVRCDEISTSPQRDISSLAYLWQTDWDNWLISIYGFGTLMVPKPVWKRHSLESWGWSNFWFLWSSVLIWPFFIFGKTATPKPETHDIGKETLQEIIENRVITYPSKSVSNANEYGRKFFVFFPTRCFLDLYHLNQSIRKLLVIWT